MKKTINLFLTLVVISILFVPSIVFAQEKDSIYGPYNNFNELYDAYFEAIESGDVEKQAELIEIGRSSLEAEIEMSENQGIQPLYDPDAMYWIQQFPTYFSYGYFEERDNGWTLSLGSKNQGVWTSTDKSNAWNATYTKFYQDEHWDNTDIMKEQFYCHARLVYSTIEAEWNLEPWRTSMNPITCN